MTRSEHVVLPSVEPTEGTGFTPLKKHKKHDTIVGQPQKRVKPLLTVKEESDEEDELRMDRVAAEESDLDVNSKDQRVDETEEAVELQQPKREKAKRRKRKSIGQQRPRRVSTMGVAPSTAYFKERRRTTDLQRERSDLNIEPRQTVTGSPNETDDVEDPLPGPKPRGRPPANAAKAPQAAPSNKKDEARKAIASKNQIALVKSPNSAKLPSTQSP